MKKKRKKFLEQMLDERVNTLIKHGTTLLTPKLSKRRYEEAIFHSIICLGSAVNALRELVKAKL